MKRILLLCIFFACIDVGDSAHAACIVNSGTPSYPDGTYLSAEICNANGAVKTSGGTGVAVAEDAAHSSGENISPIGCRRKDTAATSAGTDGDWATVDCDANGAVRVRIDSSAVGGNSQDEDGTVAAGNTSDTEVISKEYKYDGTNWKRAGYDPCQGPKTFKTVSQATSTELFTGTASNRTYFCSIFLRQDGSSTQTFTLVSGTGTVCATSTGAVTGDVAAANDVDLPFVLGNGGATVAKTDTDADNVCLLQSSTDRITGVISYVVAPN